MSKLVLQPGENKIALTITNSATPLALVISRTMNLNLFYTKTQIDVLLAALTALINGKISFARGTDAQMVTQALALVGTTAPFLFFNTDQNTPYFWNGTIFV